MASPRRPPIAPICTLKFGSAADDAVLEPELPAPDEVGVGVKPTGPFADAVEVAATEAEETLLFDRK